MAGVPIDSSLFKPIDSNIDPPRPGERLECPRCGGRFLTPEGELMVRNVEQKGL